MSEKISLDWCDGLARIAFRYDPLVRAILRHPIEELFGVQVGGGTDVDRAVAYCANRIERPSKAHLVRITDLYKGGNVESLVDRLGELIQSGVNAIVLLAPTTRAAPYDPTLAGRQTRISNSSCRME